MIGSSADTYPATSLSSFAWLYQSARGYSAQLDFSLRVVTPMHSSPGPYPLDSRLIYGSITDLEIALKTASLASRMATNPCWTCYRPRREIHTLILRQLGYLFSQFSHLHSHLEQRWIGSIRVYPAQYNLPRV
jgi:hypothetical protein